MNSSLNDTIAAVATAPLPAGVAIIRLSGIQAWNAAQQICPAFEEGAPRTAYYSNVVYDGETLDHAVVIGFKAPASFTGQDVVEIQCHGGPATVQAVLAAVLSQQGVRHAEAGEFTRRAVLNGKMDLTEAEGLADLIAAETEEQRKQALRQLDGALGEQFEKWRQQIMALVAQVEAGIDFPDEELDILADEGIQKGIKTVIDSLQSSISTDAGERLRDGFRVVILGKPNAGKSTLTNLLSGKETAIVSPIEGTTRDVVETHLNIGGFPVVLADTAGLRQSEDIIEQEGVKRATRQAEQADIVIALVDAAEWPNVDETVQEYLQEGKSLVLVTKTDVTPVKVRETAKIGHLELPVLAVNLQEFESLEPILEMLTEMVRKKFGKARESALLTRQRHRQAVMDALQFLAQAKGLLENPRPDVSLSELLAQDLRSAANSIGTVTGHTGSEDVLDLVFSTFCIGK
ncbi:MAG: tRNA uridine-5-carboxymethylaminomethyl(34) synthesis GTPase MnmE [Alphaproteobacteria bacterium]|nr:tRNA uridine-5-carboxymethylaminomethyl(34) synthesis GTPase MnmE [Alphaproteobacteria bacterium]MDD9920070.1 tRNA uridine-5-carboxymethylaminomethyl(34) synthesis GTPase MnmE [Alphaproteobacteria bacterium]